MHTSRADELDRGFTLVAPGLWAMVAVHAGALLVFLPEARPTTGVIWLAVGLFVVRTFCISAGFHRYFSHSAFKTSRWLQFSLAFIGGMGVMRGALWWAAHHRQHHQFSDKEGDPHSPMHGFLWSHMGWFIAKGNQDTREELVKDWAKYPELVWLNKHEWLPVLALIAFSYGVGGFAGFVWGAHISTICLWHATFSLNSVTHRFGPSKYEVGDTSTNLGSVALLTFGEGWHNNHHRYPARARLGEGRQIDISWWGIALLEKAGLVWGVRRGAAAKSG
jgi:stearoyl-CoA desaturase (delta-9 desaturase)